MTITTTNYHGTTASECHPDTPERPRYGLVSDSVRLRGNPHPPRSPSFHSAE